MLDQPTPAGDHPANAVRHCHRPNGLPILSTERLTASERDQIMRAARIARMIADRFDEALHLNRVDVALHATTLAADAGTLAAAAGAQLGRNR